MARRPFGRAFSVVAGLLFPAWSPAQQVPDIPGVPPISTSAQTAFQQQTHFLTFLGSHIGESSATAAAYYNAIDPSQQKRTFTKWLVNAGFISSESQWHPNGLQTFSNTPGVYGDNIVNADSHVIVLNAADLGFVRNQYVRCKPSCSAPNPVIYTYLENYPVSPFTAGGSGFPLQTGYPTQDEANAAIGSAIARPLGVKGGDGITPCSGSSNCIERIADVAFEWAPPPNGTSPNTRYGQLYAFVFSHGTAGISETIAAPSALVGSLIPDFSNPAGPFLTINAGDPFAPNLDGQGGKQHPGVCFICHGGKPSNLLSSGAYPRNGKVDGFRLLPLDVRNLMFANVGTGLDVGSQQAQIKKYNQTVLLTVPLLPQRDDQGAVRVAHVAEVIRGWYEGYPGDLSMSGTTQNGSFIPKGWREAAHGGTAKAGSEALYLHTVAPSCRSCHFNRELSLDFGTVANFDQESDLKQLALMPQCSANNPAPNLRPMPLALLTYQRLWEAEAAPRTMSDGFTVVSPVLKLKNHFGYSQDGYCLSNP